MCETSLDVTLLRLITDVRKKELIVLAEYFVISNEKLDVERNFQKTVMRGSRCQEVALQERVGEKLQAWCKEKVRN